MHASSMSCFRIILVLCAMQIFSPHLYAQAKCSDSLRNTVWRTLKKITVSEAGDCRKVLNVRPLRLGAKAAFVVRGAYGQLFCGATGNCSTWIVAGGRRPRIILYSGSVVERIEVRPRGKKYPDLSFRWLMGASDAYLGVYRFVLSRYELRGCFYEDYGTDGERSLTKAKREFCK